MPLVPELPNQKAQFREDARIINPGIIHAGFLLPGSVSEGGLMHPGAGGRLHGGNAPDVDAM
jgi:hypothetical protein